MRSSSSDIVQTPQKRRIFTLAHRWYRNIKQSEIFKMTIYNEISFIQTHAKNVMKNQVRQLYIPADLSFGFFLKKTTCINFRLTRDMFFQANPSRAGHSVEGPDNNSFSTIKVQKINLVRNRRHRVLT